MTAGPGSRVPVIVLDRRGYAPYHDRCGVSFLPASHYAVRLVTDITKIDQARGPELELVVGVPGHDGATYAEAARFLYSFGGRPAAKLITVAEQLLLPAAMLREELGITGPSLSETMLFRDKVLMKRHLRAAGLPPPVCIAIHGVFAPQVLDELNEAGAANVLTTNTVPGPTAVIDVSSVLLDALQKAT